MRREPTALQIETREFLTASSSFRRGRWSLRPDGASNGSSSKVLSGGLQDQTGLGMDDEAAATQCE
jgi:hypothetical protein